MKEDKTKKNKFFKIYDNTSNKKLLQQYVFENNISKDTIDDLSYKNRKTSPTQRLVTTLDALEEWQQYYVDTLINKFSEQLNLFPKYGRLNECHCSNNLKKEFYNCIYTINQYNPDKIINQVKQYAREAKLDSTTAVTLIQNTKIGLIKIILSHKFYCNTTEIADIANQEINLLNLEYHLKNESLRVLSPQKYTNFLTMIRKGIEAYYLDIKAYPIIGNKFTSSIQLFFNALLERIQEISIQYATEIEVKPKLLEIQQTVFPSHIFSNAKAHENYKQMENKAKTAEDIGFLFRHLSEKQNPPTIITTETKFRKWYNNQPDLKIILKTPIKTYNAIGGKDKKANILLLPPP